MCCSCSKFLDNSQPYSCLRTSNPCLHHIFDQVQLHGNRLRLLSYHCDDGLLLQLSWLTIVNLDSAFPLTVLDYAD